jgi:UDP-N-acetyl-D-glucosamine dehydrogenase
MRGTASLRRRVLDRRARVGVIGQGYVGVSLACAAADAGFEVAGIDVDRDRIDALARGEHVVAGVTSAVLGSGFRSGRITFTTDGSVIEECDLVFVCVPTPLKDHMPDLSFVSNACRTVAEHLTRDSMVVLESTTYPGTTEQLVLPILETGGLKAGSDFLLAYSPERIDPGNDSFSFREIPRIVGGINAESTGMATLFYEQIVDKAIPLSSCRAAELAKLLENTFRHVNIALVNETAVVCNEIGIDVWEVIHAAASKPFGFMAFEPGPGVGGHCIPLDPTYLSWQVKRDTEHRFRIVELAEEINGEMPGYVAARVADLLNDRGKAVKGARILILGVAYKPDVGDVRESPSLKVIANLRRRGARVTFHDPFVEWIQPNGEVLARTELTRAGVASADCVVLLTPHSDYDLDWLADHAKVLFDARNAMGQKRPGNVIRL